MFFYTSEPVISMKTKRGMSKTNLKTSCFLTNMARKNPINGSFLAKRIQESSSTAPQTCEKTGFCHAERPRAWGLPIEVEVTNVVVPAQAGTHAWWIPAFAGMT